MQWRPKREKALKGIVSPDSTDLNWYQRLDLKGTGTRDHYGLKVTWLNRPGLVLPPDRSLNF